MSKKICWPPAEKIIVLRALQLGDLLCAVPAFRKLRQIYPHAHIALVGLPWSKIFRDRFSSYIDEFIEFPGYPGLPERSADVAAFPDFLQKIQKRNFDLALQWHGSGSYVNSIVSLFGAKACGGFYVPGEWCPNDQLFVPFPEQGHEIERLLKIFFPEEIPADETRLEFPLSENDQQELSSLPDLKSLHSDFVCVHAGSRLLSRRWAPERFAQVADRLIDKGLDVVLTGSSDESPTVQSVSRNIRGRHFNLAGRTSLGAVGALLSKAKLLVSNDTGVSHIASAVSCPSIIINTGSDASRWSPLNRSLHKTVSVPVSCRPCAHYECPIGQPCATGVTADMVVDAIEGTI